MGNRTVLVTGGAGYLDNGGSTNYFNIGTNTGNTVKEVFYICEKITGENIPLKIKPRRVGDPTALVACNKKAQMQIGWKPNKPLFESIKNAYKWEQIHE